MSAWDTRVFLTQRVTPSKTINAQGPSVALGRLHSTFADNIASAIKEAKRQGLNVTVNSAYRPPALKIGGYKNKYNSLHAYGLAVDLQGIGARGSKDLEKWDKIAKANGLFNPYGMSNQAEFNHYQAVPEKGRQFIEANPQLRDAITAEGPIDVEAMWEASGVPVQKPVDPFGVVGFQNARLAADAPAGKTSPTPPGSIPDVSLASTYGTLKRRVFPGKKLPPPDPRVRELQRMLNENFGFDLKEDGLFGESTEIAVKTFQKTMGLTDAQGRPQYDGVAGTKTWGAIESVTRPDMSLESRDARALVRATPGVAGNAVSTRSQQSAARLQTPQPQRPSPFDVLSGVSTRPSPSATPPEESVEDFLRRVSSVPSNLVRRPELVASADLAPQQAMERPSLIDPAREAATSQLREQLPARQPPMPRPNPMRPRPPTSTEAARFDPENRVFDSVVGSKYAPLNDRLEQARQRLDALTRDMGPRPSPGSISDMVRGSTTTPARRPSPLDPLTSVVTRPAVRPSPPTGGEALHDMNQAVARPPSRPSLLPAGDTVSSDVGLYSGRNRMAPGAKAALSAGVGLMAGGPLGALIAGGGSLIKNSRNKKTEIEDLQRSLRDNGFDPGPVDGIMGPRTENAISLARGSPSSGTRAMTAPRPRPTLATRPSPTPRQPTREEAFATRDAADFAGLSRPSLARPASISAPLPRPSPLPPGQGAAASANRTASRPTLRSSSEGAPRKASTLDRVKSAFRTQDASLSMKDRVRASRL